MAVIKNHKTGMWEVRTYYKDLTGERKQKTKRGFAKKSEALEWERNFKLKVNQSISMSFQSFVDIYLTDLEPRIKRNTFLTKKHIIETKINAPTLTLSIFMSKMTSKSSKFLTETVCICLRKRLARITQKRSRYAQIISTVPCGIRLWTEH